MEVSDAFLKKAKTPGSKPIVLAQFESSNAIDKTETTQADWESGTLTDMDTTETPGDVLQDIFPVAMSANVGLELIYSASYEHFGDTYYGKVHWNKSQLPTTVSFRLRITDDLSSPTFTAYGESVSVTKEGENATAYYAMVSLPGTTDQLSADQTYYTFAQVWDGSSWREDLGFWATATDSNANLIKLSGQVVTDVIDLGLVPTINSILSIDDTTVTGTSITYTAKGGNSSPPTTDLGTVSDGDELAPYQYYEITAAFSTTNGERAVLHELTLSGGNNQFIYLGTHDGNPLPEVKALLPKKPIGTQNSKVDLLKIATTGETTLDVLWTPETADMITTGQMKNKAVSILFGFDGLAKAEFLPIFGGTWYDYAIDENRGLFKIKIRDVLKQYAKAKVPRATVDGSGNKTTTPITISEQGLMANFLDIHDAVGVQDRYLNRTRFTNLNSGEYGGDAYKQTRTISKPTSAKDLLEELQILARCFFISDGRAKLQPVYNPEPWVEGWNTQPYTTTNCTATLYGANSGRIRVDTSALNSQIEMYSLGSFDPERYRYLRITYKTIDSVGAPEIFFLNDTYATPDSEAKITGPTQKLSASWQQMTIDLWEHEKWKTGGNISGWRFDPSGVSGVTIYYGAFELLPDIGPVIDARATDSPIRIDGQHKELFTENTVYYQPNVADPDDDPDDYDKGVVILNSQAELDWDEFGAKVFYDRWKTGWVSAAQASTEAQDSLVAYRDQWLANPKREAVLKGLPLDFLTHDPGQRALVDNLRMPGTVMRVPEHVWSKVLPVDGLGVTGAVAEDSASLGFTTSAMTIEGWIYPMAFKNEKPFLCREASYEVATDDNGFLKAAIQTTAAWSWIASTKARLDPYTWNHFAIVYDGTDVHFYVNAVLMETIAHPNGGAINDSSAPLRFGHRQFVPTPNSVNAMFGEIRIWNTARTAANISDNWKKKLIGSESGLQALWLFEDALDTTANNNDLTLLGSSIHALESEEHCARKQMLLLSKKIDPWGASVDFTAKEY